MQNSSISSNGLMPTPSQTCPPEGVYMFCASFLSAEGLAQLSFPLRSPRGDVEIVRVTTHAVLSVSRKVMRVRAIRRLF